MSTGGAARRRARRAARRRRRSAPGRACRAGSPSRAGRRRRRARSRSRCSGSRGARERRLGAARLRPRRQQAREQGRAGAVRVLVEGHVEVRARLVDQLEQRLDQLAAPSDFRCERCSGAPARRATSISSPTASSTPRALVADVRDERRAERGRLLGDRDELVGAGVRAGDVDEAEREHPRARLEAEPDLAPHRARAARRTAARRRRRARSRAPTPWPIDGTSDSAGRVASSASRYSANVVHVHSAGPSPSSARRYARRASRRSGATGAGASPSGQITSVVKPCSSFGVSSGSSHAASAECACRSMKPGQSIAPAPSTTSAASTAPSSPTAAISPSATATSAHDAAGAVAREDRRAADDEVKQRRTCRRRRTGSGR